jgi:RHS repeat-associated protein/uncharacterized repeat protein (TIGR01451 family)
MRDATAGLARRPVARRGFRTRLGWLVATIALLAGGFPGSAPRAHHVPPAPEHCPLSQGYWKTHPEAWPRSSLVLGSPTNPAQTYPKSALLALLGTATHGDASLILADQLIAAKLNVASGSNPGPIATALAQADSLLGGFHGPLPYHVSSASSTGRAMTATAGTLEAYNTGHVADSCAPANHPPTASAGPDQTVFVLTTVQLDGSHSTDVDGDLLTFHWTLVSVPSGSAARLSDPSAVRPTFVVDRRGTYVVQLVVNDGASDSAPDSVKIDTKNSRPVAKAGPDQTVPVGSLVYLDGSASSDVDGDHLKYCWRFLARPAGSHATLTDPAAVRPAFTADLPGRYTLELVVNDGALDSAPDTVEIDTGSSRPRADAGADLTASVGDMVQLDGRRSSDADGDPLTFRWSFTTRPPGSAAQLAHPDTAQPTFVPDVAGTYVAQLIVNDGTADSAPDTVVVTVGAGNRAPVADAGPDQTVTAGTTVRLDGSRSFDPEGAPLTFAWMLLSRPAGSAAALSSATVVGPTFVADRSGPYTIQLVVGDGALLSAPDTVTVTARDGADLRVAFVDPSTAPAVGSSVSLAVEAENRGPSSATGVTVQLLVPAGYTVTSAAVPVGTYDGVTGVWTVGALPAGAAARLTLTATVRATGPYDLAATVTATSPADPDPTNNSATVPVTPRPSADLRIAFVDPPAAPAVGSSVGLTVEVANGGPASATGVTARFQPPAGYAVTAVAVPVGSYDAATGAWTIGALAAGAAVRLTLTATVGATGPYDLAAALTGSSPADPNAANDSATAFVTPGAATADLGIAFVSPPAVLVVGSSVGLTVEVANGGPASATGVTARFRLPAGFTPTAAATQAGTYDGTTGDWTIGTLAAGAAVRLTLTATVGATGPYDLAAAITGSSPTDPNPANDTASASVTPNHPPVASAGPDQTVFVGDTVQLEGAGSTDADGDSLTFRWSLASIPAGSAATLSDPTAVRPTFRVDRPGTYEAHLTVNDGRTDSLADVVLVSTQNSRPVANAGPDRTVPLGAVVQLDGSASSDVDGDALTYRWTLVTAPASSHATLTDPAAAGPAFTADAPGRYVAQLIVNDGALDSVADSVEIDTSNSRPVAEAGPDQTVTVGDVVQLDGSASTDADGDALAYRWSLTTRPDGSAAAFDDPAAARPTFVADVAGLYVAQLIVSDGTEDSAPDTVAMTAAATPNQPPVADAGPDQTVARGVTVRLDGSRSSDPEGRPLSFLWTLLSRPSGSAAVLSGATTATPSFVADVNGAYAAQLVVNDGALDSAPDSVTVTVRDGADLSIAFVSPPTNPPVGGLASPTGIFLQVVNHGPADATGVVARFQLPAGYTVRSLSVGRGAYDGATGTWTIGSLSPGDFGNLSFDALVNAAGPYDLTATITGSSAPDPDLTNNAATAVVTPNRNADLGVRFISAPSSPPVGGLASPSGIFIEVHNHGPAATTGVTAQFPIPAGYTIRSTSVGRGTYDPATGAWTIGGLASGDSANLSFDAFVNATGPYDLTATITGSDGPDLNLANNAVTVVVTPNRNADLRLFFFDFPQGTLAPGAPANLALEVNNGGPASTTGVTVSVPVPSGYTITGQNIQVGTYDAATGTWVVGALPSGGLARMGLSLRVNATGPTAITATVIRSDQPDPNLANNLAVVPAINRPPVANAGTDQTAGVNTTVPLDGRASSDADGDALSFQWTFALRPVNSAAVLVGASTATPTFVPDLGGTYRVQLVVTDGRGAASAASITTVLVSADDHAPVIRSTPVTAAAVGVAYRYAVDAVDPDAGDALTFSLPTAPPGMAIDAAGIISWTPSDTQGGPQAVVVRVADQRGLFATQAFEVQVSSAANGAPVATDDAYEVRLGESLSVGAPGVLANDTDANGTPLAAVLLTPPTNGALSFNADGSFIYTPHTLQAGELVLAEDVDLIRAIPGTTFSMNGDPGSVGPPCERTACAFDDNLGTMASTAGINPATYEVVFPQDVTVTRVQVVSGRHSLANRITSGVFQLLAASGTVLHDSGPVEFPLPDRDATLVVPGVAGVRRVRFTPLTGERSPFEINLAEMKVIGSALLRRQRTLEPNLAQLLPATVQAGSFVGFNVPESVIDDHAGTNWYAAAGNGDFIEITFPVDVTVTGIETLNPSATPDGFGSSSPILCHGTFQLLDASRTVLFDSGVVNTPFNDRGIGPSLFTLPVPTTPGVRSARYTVGSCAGSAFPAGFSEIRVLGTAPVATPAFQLTKKLQALAGREAHSTPVVANLTDDNGDGRIDARDVPDIVVPVESATDQLRGEIFVLSGDDGRVLFTAGSPDLVSPWSEVAVGDLDGNGLPSIVAVHSDGNHLIAFDHTGAVKWISDPNPMPRFFIGSSALIGGAVSIANLDGGPRPHIIVGASVFDADGRLLGDGRTLGGTIGGTGLRSAISAVVDLDLDGIPEIVAGPTAYRLVNGRLEVVWQRTDLPDGYVAIGNFDDDPFPEVVIVADGKIYMLNHDGTDAEVWNPPSHGPVLTPGAPEGAAGPANGQSGAPLVVDVDGDGIPEIGIAKAANYLLYNRDGSLRWKAAISDRSSHSTGSVAFDFDGDGTVEIVYRDERFLRIFRGADGVLLAKVLVQSATWAEQPVVVDVDNDGHADIVVASDLSSGLAGDTGVFVFRDVANKWRRTRRIWNQHSYHVTNVNEDGSIPVRETPHWLVPGLNGFRTNAFVPGETADASDSFAYVASDGVLESNPATVRIAVRTPNSAPQFTSSPVTSAGTGVRYVYGARASDPDAGDVLTFSLPTAPAGMTIQPSTGLVEWTPTAAQLGRRDVVIKVSDARGLFAVQGYAVTVASPVTVPAVVGQPQAAAQAAITGAALAVGTVATHTSATVASGAVISQSPAGGSLVAPGAAVSLVVSLGPPPVGTVPDVVGQLQTAAQADITAAGFALGPVTSVNSALVPLGLVLSQNPAAGTTATAGTAVSLVVSLGPPPGDVDADRDGFTGNQGDCNDTDAGINPNAIDIAGDGIDQNCNGRDSGAGDTTPPAASIDSPADLAVVTMPTDIVGTATDANFLRYTLELAGLGDTTFRLLASGTSPVVSGVLGRLDPTLLENGMYRVRLTAEDVNGQRSIAERVYRMTGEAKVGMLALGFVDVQVPVSGVAITVIRSYDSRVKTPRDFGVGWSLQVKSGKYQNNRRPGDGWTVTTAPGPFGLPCSVTTETAAHATELRLSEREFYLFRPRLTSLAAVVGGCVGTVTFELVDGVLPGATLQVLGNADIIYTSGDVVTEFDGGTDTGLVFDPPQVRLVTIDGRTIDFDRTAGITRVQDGNGNTLSITDAGITHSAGKSIAFTRDGQGRIVAITDPNGHRTTYAHDTRGDLVEFVDQAGNRTTFVYDDRHNLVEMHDPLGNRALRAEYDADGRLTAMIDARGNRVQFTHALDARQEVITDARGNVRRLGYDEFGNVRSEERAVTIEGTQVLATSTYVADGLGNVLVAVDPDGQRTEASYDRTSLLDEVVDPDGLALLTRRAYDGAARLSSLTNPAGEATTTVYDRFGNVRQFRDASGATVQMEYDALGHLAQLAAPTGVTKRTTYDPLGNLVREEQVDATGTLLTRRDFAYDVSNNVVTDTVFRTVDGVLQPLTTIFTYDVLNRVVAVRDPAGNVSRTEYNALGLESATVDALGRRTAYTYDEVGSLTRVDHPDGTVETRQYDASGNLVAVTDGGGRTTTFEYDELNRQVLTRRADSTSERRIYSPGGRVTAIIDARGHRTDYGYDTAGRRTRITLPEVLDGLTGAARRPERRLELDSVGRKLAEIDPNGRRTEFAYDGAGRLVAVTFADGTRRSRSYDELGRLAEERDEAGRSTRFEYDGLGRLLAVTDPAGGRTRYGYDEVGNRILQVDALGRTTRYRYDALNRLVEKTLPGGERETFAYDAVGSLVAHTDFNGNRVTYQYDAMNRPTRKRLPDGTEIVSTYTATGQRRSVTDARGTTTYEYDVTERLARVTHPGGEVVGYGYDAGGQLRQLSSPAATVDYEYDALDRLTQASAPLGVTSYAYDAAGNLVETTAANGVVSRRRYDARNRLTDLQHTVSGVVLGSFTYERSPTGRRLRSTEAGGSVETYAYDTLDRVVGETRTGANPRAIGYEYDAVGNRMRMVRDGVPTAYEYDTDDRLLAAGTTTYSYDANGNVLSRTSAGATATYTWDFDNRLTAVADPAGTTAFTYDADGNLVGRQSGGAFTRLLVDTNSPSGLAQVLEERDGTGALLTQYVYGTRLYGMIRGGSPFFHLTDGLGSIRLLTDGTGGLTDSYDYDAFGNLAAASGDTPNPYRFAGERLEPSLGLYQLRARWMDPATGRFVSRDAFPGVASDPATQHAYLYADGDPVNALDPTGYFTLIETQETVGILNELASQSLTILRYYRQAQRIAEIIELVHDIGQAAATAVQILDGGITVGFPGTAFTTPSQAAEAAQRNLLERIGQALEGVTVESAAERLAANLPRLTAETLYAWGPTLLLAGPSDIRAFLLYLPNPIPIPAPFTIPTGIRVHIGRTRIPVRAVFGGPDIGRLAGAGLEMRGRRNQVWAMDLGLLVARQAGFLTRPYHYGHVSIGWTDAPYLFRVMRAPNW